MPSWWLYPVRRAATGHTARFKRSRVSVGVIEGQRTGRVCSCKVAEHQILSLLRLIGDQELGALDVQALRQRHRSAEVHRPFDRGDCAPWPRTEVFREFDRPRDDLFLRDKFVDGSVGERLRGRERLALEDGNQGAVGADQAGQSLSAATAWIDSEEHFRVADEKVAVSHDAQVARPGEFRAEAESRTVEGSHEDDAATIHPQERRVQTVELNGSLQRSPGYHGVQHAGAVRDFGRAYDGGGA